MVAGEGSAGFERVEGGEAGLRSFGEAAGDREVEVDEGRRRELAQLDVQRRDRGPIRRVGRVRPRDLRLQPVRTAHAVRSVEQELRLADRCAIPAGAILLLERDHVSGGIRTRVTPGVLQQHQREQGPRLVLRSGRDELEGEPCEADRLGGEVDPQQVLAGRRRVSLGEDEVQHREDAVEAFGQLFEGRYAERDPGVRRCGASPGRSAAPWSAPARGTPGRSRRS